MDDKKPKSSEMGNRERLSLLNKWEEGDFRIYENTIKRVETFKYLESIITQYNFEWMEIIENIRKEKLKW